jgi:hypothetical protein
MAGRGQQPARVRHAARIQGLLAEHNAQLIDKPCPEGGLLRELGGLDELDRRVAGWGEAGSGDVRGDKRQMADGGWE